MLPNKLIKSKLEQVVAIASSHAVVAVVVVEGFWVVLVPDPGNVPVST